MAEAARDARDAANFARACWDWACLDRWYPPVAATGVATPTTLWLRGVPAAAPAAAVADRLAALAAPLGVPFFLRTGLYAARTGWAKTCWVTDPARLSGHVEALRAAAGGAGPPTVWAVRQALPLRAFGHASGAAGMPLATEVRLFTRGAQPLCWHPLWPLAALGRLGCAPPDWADRHRAAHALGGQEREALWLLSARVGCALAAASGLAGWGLDWAAVADGRWCLIDAAPAAAVWHGDCASAHQAALPAPPAAAELTEGSPAAPAAAPGTGRPEAYFGTWLFHECLEEPAAAAGVPWEAAP